MTTCRASAQQVEVKPTDRNVGGYEAWCPSCHRVVPVAGVAGEWRYRTHTR